VFDEYLTFTYLSVLRCISLRLGNELIFFSVGVGFRRIVTLISFLYDFFRTVTLLIQVTKAPLVTWLEGWLMQVTKAPLVTWLEGFEVLSQPDNLGLIPHWSKLWSWF
jgi:hypothetical protein